MQDILQMALRGRKANAVALYFLRHKVTYKQARADVDALVHNYNIHNAPMQVGLAAVAEYEEAILGQDIYEALI